MQIIGGQTLFAQGRVKTLPYKMAFSATLPPVEWGKSMVERGSPIKRVTFYIFWCNIA
jgi:hypothetical protein